MSKKQIRETLRCLILAAEEIMDFFVWLMDDEDESIEEGIEEGRR